MSTESHALRRGLRTRLPPALRLRGFRWYFIARSVSTIGATMAPVALAFAVLDVSLSPSSLGIVVGVRIAATIAFSPAGGVVADRVSRLRVLIGSHVATGVTQGLAAGLIISGHAEIWMLVLIEAINGAAFAFTFPALTGVVPELVRGKALQQTNALLSLSRNAIGVLGPSLAALITVSIGAGWALAVDSFTYFAAVACLSRIEPTGPPPANAVDKPQLSTPPEGWLAALRAGLVEFASRRWVWTVVAVFAVLNMVYAGVFSVVGPLVATTAPSLGRTGWGLTLGAYAFGTVVVTLPLLRRVPRRPLRAGLAGLSLVALPILLLGIAPRACLLVASAFLAGIGSEIFNVGWTSALQEHIPNRLLSRVSSIDMLASYLAIPAGTVVYGFLATDYRTGPLLVTSALLYGGLSLSCLAVASVRDLECRAESVPSG